MCFIALLLLGALITNPSAAALSRYSDELLRAAPSIEDRIVRSR